MSMMCRLKWPFLHMYESHDIKHVDFRGLTGSQQTSRVWGVTAMNLKRLSIFLELKIIYLKNNNNIKD